MANKLSVISQLRPRIKSQKVQDLETIAGRMAKNTTYNSEEIFSIFRLGVKEILAALQDGDAVKIDGLVVLTANMRVGGEVDLVVRGDRGAVASLNDSTLWTASKVINHANMNKSSEELLELWNAKHPDDPAQA